MTGPEHYREAERLLAQADRDVSENWPVQTGERKADILAAAQAHATLALAAVQAEPWLYDTDDRTGSYVNHEWIEALS